MPAGKEAQPECISQRASSGRLNCSCSRSRDLTAINPVVPEMMKIAALAVSTAPGGNMSFAFSKSVPIAPAKGRGKRTPAWTNRRAKALVPCGFADAKTAKGILQYQNSRKRLSNCPRIPREEVRKYGSFQSGAKYGIYRYEQPPLAKQGIVLADTGAEHPHTYQFIEIINQWLAEHGMPQITVVQYVDRYGNRLSLETECLRSHTLPSIAYGHKRCSQKHKIAPQEKFCNHYAPCREVWQRGEKVNRYIGYDAGEVKRYEHSRKYNEADKKYHNRYPLIEEWGWNRDDCIREIKAAGLPQPGKSSCFFCPSMKKQEILYLKEHYPDLFNRAATLEENAMPYLKTVKGLGRSYSWKEQFGKE